MSAEEAVKYINSLSDKNSQLGAMSKNIKSITDALGTKASDGLVSVDDLSGFDVTIKGLSTWEKFSTILGDASSSMEDCQKVANELATEYVNSESVLSNLNETNRAYYESQHDNMGVTNSAAVVEAALAKNLGKNDDAQIVTSSRTAHELGKDCNFILPRLVNTYQSDEEEVKNKIKSNLNCNVQITYNPTAMIGYGYKS